MEAAKPNLIVCSSPYTGKSKGYRFNAVEAVEGMFPISVAIKQSNNNQEL